MVQLQEGASYQEYPRYVPCPTVPPLSLTHEGVGTTATSGHQHPCIHACDAAAECTRNLATIWRGGGGGSDWREQGRDRPHVVGWDIHVRSVPPWCICKDNTSTTGEQTRCVCIGLRKTVRQKATCVVESCLQVSLTAVRMQVSKLDTCIRTASPIEGVGGAAYVPPQPETAVGPHMDNQQLIRYMCERPPPQPPHWRPCGRRASQGWGGFKFPFGGGYGEGGAQNA